MKDIFGDDTEKKESEDFAALLSAASKVESGKLKKGDKVRGQILSIGKEECFASTGTPLDALIIKSELLDEAGQPLYKVGDAVEFTITHVSGQEVRGSLKGKLQAAEALEDAYDMELPVEGRVLEALPNGGFKIQLMGKTAFCPISQMDARFTEDPSLFVGKKLEFLITQFDSRGRNIVVSRRKWLDRKRLENEGSFLLKTKPGDLLKGLVTRIEKYGAFVELEAGIEGLVHISEVSWSRLEHPSEVLSLNAQVDVKVLSISEEGNRLKINLSIKQAEPPPWAGDLSDLVVGNVVKGVVRRCAGFGAFVELRPGIEGLIPLSEMSYKKRAVKAEDFVKEKEQVLVRIKEVNLIERKILLSLRDAEGSDNPWLAAVHKYPVGTLVKAKVEQKLPFGFLLELEEGLSGLLHQSTFRGAEVNEGDAKIQAKKPGDMIEVVVKAVKPEERKVELVLPGQLQDDSWRENFKDTKEFKDSPFASLSSLLKGQKK